MLRGSPIHFCVFILRSFTKFYEILQNFTKFYKILQEINMAFRFNIIRLYLFPKENQDSVLAVDGGDEFGIVEPSGRSFLTPQNGSRRQRITF